MKRYLICSGKGGVGKSTLSVCIARALCARGKSVLLTDCDVGLRALDLLTGLGQLHFVGCDFDRPRRQAVFADAARRARRSAVCRSIFRDT